MTENLQNSLEEGCGLEMPDNLTDLGFVGVVDRYYQAKREVYTFLPKKAETSKLNQKVFQPSICLMTGTYMSCMGFSHFPSIFASY